MNRLISLLLLMLCAFGSYSQNERTSDEVMTGEFSGIIKPLPRLREIRSGTKIVVTYEGDVPEELKGAFEYAVKIWEENLPPAMPIFVSVKSQKLKGSNANTISQVSLWSKEFGSEENNIDAPLSMIKGAWMLDYINNDYPVRFESMVSDPNILYGNAIKDIVITYNSDLLDECSFAIAGTPNADKYDFVTLAMRDIAKGLGFLPYIYGNPTKSELWTLGNHYTPYETVILTTLTGRFDLSHSFDKAVAFQNATKGSVEISSNNLYQIHGSPYDDVCLYAPTTWDNNSSLRYMIPAEGNPITYLLNHKFGKGDMMRDLSGFNMEWFFRDFLDWNNAIATGEPDIYNRPTGSSSDILPFKGNVNIPVDYFSPYSTNSIAEEPTDTIDDGGDIYPSAREYLTRLNPYSPNGHAVGTSLSVLKKDGFWDLLYTTKQPTTINIEDFPLHEDEEKYARGTTGGLRYRLTQCYRVAKRHGSGYRYAYKTQYFTRDFTPQTPIIKFSKIHQESAQQNARSVSIMNNDEDYYVDVEIGMSQMEGAKRVIVEQWDEGEMLPFQYEIEDFNQGYFVVNLDRECATDISVGVYNDNGFRWSEPIHIEAIGYSETTAEFSLDHDNIIVSGLSERKLSSGNVSYRINSVISNINVAEARTLNGKEISIANLQPGVYVVALYDRGEPIGTFKFKK